MRVVLPHHLRTLAGTGAEVRVESDAATVRELLDAVERLFPALVGTMRDAATGERRRLVRFFACREDLSHDGPDAPLPDAVRRGEEPFLVVGAMAGG